MRVAARSYWMASYSNDMLANDKTKEKKFSRFRLIAPRWRRFNTGLALTFQFRKALFSLSQFSSSVTSSVARSNRLENNLLGAFVYGKLREFPIH